MSTSTNKVAKIIESKNSFLLQFKNKTKLLLQEKSKELNQFTLAQIVCLEDHRDLQKYSEQLFTDLRYKVDQLIQKEKLSQSIVAIMQKKRVSQDRESNWFHLRIPTKQFNYIKISI